jgi:hypothetical protein
MRPDYCPDLDADDLAFPIGPHRPCPACGATIEGKDPVRGVCQARFNGPKPRPLARLVLIDKRTGDIVAST